MNLTEIRAEMARLDTILEPIAKSPVDTTDPDWATKMSASPSAVDRTGIRARAERVLWAIVALYPENGAEIRDLFGEYTSFRWAAYLPRDWHTAEDFRARLIHLSACDQGSDTRDEILTLRSLCEQATAAGIEVTPILAEVADMSSEVDKYGMGSMRDVIFRFS